MSANIAREWGCVFIKNPFDLSGENEIHKVLTESESVGFWLKTIYMSDLLQNRHRSDKKVNNRKVQVLINGE